MRHEDTENVWLETNFTTDAQIANFHARHPCAADILSTKHKLDKPTRFLLKNLWIVISPEYVKEEVLSYRRLQNSAQIKANPRTNEERKYQHKNHFRSVHMRLVYRMTIID